MYVETDSDEQSSALTGLSEDLSEEDDDISLPENQDYANAVGDQNKLIFF